MKKYTVLLSDDHLLVRKALRQLLKTAGDIRIVGEAADGHAAVREAMRLLPDVVLMDLSMPGLGGLEAARQIRRLVPSVRVIILSAYGDVQFVRHAIEGGAAGYWMKGAATTDLLRAIREVMLGNQFFSPSQSGQSSRVRPGKRH